MLKIEKPIQAKPINYIAVIRVVLLVLIGVCGAVLSYGQNNGKVEGSVIVDGAGVPFATVRVKDKAIGTITDENGQFILEDLPRSSFTLQVTFVGFDTSFVDVDLSSDRSLKLKPIKLSQSNVSLNEVVVQEKMNEGEEKALKMMQESARLTNVVSAKGMERLPDKNAAEALQRMPGVVMETDQGEGSYISFRGTPTDWGSALVNGDRLPVANEEDVGRSLSFEVLPTSLIEYIEYNQNLSPDIEGDAIGGSANFYTKFVPDQRKVEVQAGYGYNVKAGAPLWNASLLAGDRFGKDKKLGFVAGGSVYQRNWATDNYEIFYSNNDNHNIERLELRRYDGNRVTYGAHGKLQYDFNKNNNIHVLGFYGRQDDTEYNRKTMYNWVAGVGQSIVLQNIHNIMINDAFGVDVGGDHKIDDKWSVDWKLASYGSGWRYGPTPFGDDDDRSGYHVIEYEKLVRYQDYLYLDENGNRTDEQNAFERFRLLDIDSPFDDYGDPADNLNPRYENIVAVKPEDTLFTHRRTYSELRKVYESDPIVARANVSYKFSPFTVLTAGLKYRRKEGSRSYGLAAWVRDPQKYRDPIRYDENELYAIPHKSTFLDEEGGHYKEHTGLFLSDDDMKNWVDNNADKLQYLPYGPKTTPAYKQFVGSNYRYEEDVYTGFAMLNTTLLEDLKVNFGVRLEETKVGITSDRAMDTSYFDLETGQVIVESWLEEDHIDRNYLAVLPMLNLNYQINKKSSVRAAVTRSFRRPNFNEMKPGEPEVHYTHFHSLYGNPDLKPTYSTNVDVSYQRYFGFKGLFAVTGFYKYVTDHIYTAFRSEAADVNGVSNAFRPPGGILAKEFQNAPYAHVGGIEVTLQKQLSFLPGKFKNLGISLNYAYTASGMKIPSRDDLQPLPRQAANVFNARLTYEDKKWSANVAVNYRDPYLAELNLIAVRDPQTGEAVVFNNSNEFDMYMGLSLGMDASVSYQVTEKLQAYAEANNLLNTPFVMYRGERDRPVQVEYYGIRGLVGIRYQLF